VFSLCYSFLEEVERLLSVLTEKENCAPMAPCKEVYMDILKTQQPKITTSFTKSRLPVRHTPLVHGANFPPAPTSFH
jgi:hypothetical protein